MKINLSSFADSDTLQICYWTDSGLEKYKWYYIFKDANSLTLDKSTNPIDSSTHTKPLDRKNYISFTVHQLRQLIKSNHVAKILVEFQQDNSASIKEYLHIPVCIISNN
jgi:hypothetical protein